MVYSIDKLDGSVVSLSADGTELKYDSEQDVVVTFFKYGFDSTTKDNKGRPYGTFIKDIVGCYYLSNIVGFRKVEGITDDELAEMFKAETIAMNEDGEYCVKDDNDDGNTEELIF